MLQASDLKIERSLKTLTNGQNMFCQIIQSATKTPTYMLVFFHGYSSHSDLYIEALSELARQGALVVMFDLPCHGRSDGFLCYTPDWWTWVDQIWAVVDNVVPALRTQSGRPDMKVFAGGISLGGGLVACLAVQRPTFFNGVVLVCPMLGVADDVKPPKVVQIVFKRVLGPFKLSWPITPVKDLADFDFRVHEQGHAYTKANPFSMQGLPVRLASAKELGFTFPDWMEKHLSSMKTPFLVMHGLSDKITDANLSKRLYEEAATADKTIKLYDGAFHCELMCCVKGNGEMIGTTWLPEQKAQTETCLKDMAEWLAARA